MIITAKQEYCNHDVRLFRYGLCNDAFSIEDYFVNGSIIGYDKLDKKWLSLTWSTNPAFAWKDWGKLWETSVRIVEFWQRFQEIRNVTESVHLLSRPPRYV